ncbi:hypothetical protein [Agarivorans sp. Z349TD_8]|uniref:hypothetical protein n=1 Tax=Agarivorans sp. Z349TD_8 TaxID=3421434 RepID=UPI003D7D6E8F
MLIPSKKQFLKWTMLSKIGYLSGVLGFIMASIQITLWLLPDKVGYSDRLIQEQNKPEVKIARVEFQNFYQEPEPYIVVILENTSHVTARNINIKMLGENRVFDLPQGGIALC